MNVARRRPYRSQSDQSLDRGPSRAMWLALALAWWFLGYVAFHFAVEHRVHLLGTIGYVAVIVVVPFLYLVARRRRAS